jgi:NADPH:quinone reductase-like Zn-dependent oxidoreductase
VGYRSERNQNLHQETESIPSPGDGEVLVKIHAVSLNYRDTERMGDHTLISTIFWRHTLAIAA